MSLHLFVVAKDGSCATLGAFPDRGRETMKVYSRSGAVAGIYTTADGAVLSTVDMPSDAQLRALKSFALATLTGVAPTQPAPVPVPSAPKGDRDAKPVKVSKAARRAAALDRENVTRLRAVPGPVLVHQEPDEGEPDAFSAGPEDFGGTDFPDDVADAALRLLEARSAKPPPRPSFDERAADLRARLAEMPPPAVVVPAPRYDETFVAGTAWLDAQAEAPRCGTTHHADCDCQRDARGEPRADATSEPPRRRSVIEAMREQYEHDCALPDDPSAPELERVRALLVDETAARAAAVEQGAALAADVASLRSELAETVRARDLALAMVTLRQRDCDARDGLIVTLRAALDVERAALAHPVAAIRAALARRAAR